MWTPLCVYTAMNGAAPELGPSVVLLLSSSVAAPSTIPIFLARGDDPESAVGGPLVVSGIPMITYHGIASRTAAWRAVRTAGEAPQNGCSGGARAKHSGWYALFVSSSGRSRNCR
jgi:hypothetical protein